MPAKAGGEGFARLTSKRRGADPPPMKSPPLRWSLIGIIATRRPLKFRKEYLSASRPCTLSSRRFLDLPSRKANALPLNPALPCTVPSPVLASHARAMMLRTRFPAIRLEPQASLPARLRFQVPLLGELASRLVNHRPQFSQPDAISAHHGMSQRILHQICNRRFLAASCPPLHHKASSHRERFHGAPHKGALPIGRRSLSGAQVSHSLFVTFSSSGRTPSATPLSVRFSARSRSAGRVAGGRMGAGRKRPAEPAGRPAPCAHPAFAERSLATSRPALLLEAAFRLRLSLYGHRPRSSCQRSEYRNWATVRPKSTLGIATTIAGSNP